VAGIRHAGTKVGYSSLGPEVDVAAPAGNCGVSTVDAPCLYALSTLTNLGSQDPELDGYSVSAAMAASTRLPFARRDLQRWLGAAARCEEALKILKKKKLIEEYPPLCERPGVRIAQYEHTIFIHEDRAEVMTRLSD
jgi:serine protease